ncbi:MAG: hypothetical protein RQ968_01805 [Thermoproteota archaeon]|jgi:hypothetical protein|nr:hypothetical protein [Thermoproteota archaeon]
MAKKKINEESLYEPIKVWLESKGYKAIISGKKGHILLPTGSLLGVKYLEPDVIGYKKEGYKDCLAIVEAKTDPALFFDGLGRCFVYKMVANYVYLALPKEIAEKIGTDSLFEEKQGAGLGVGILAVDLEGNKVEVRVEAKETFGLRIDLRDILVKMVKSKLGIKE